MKLFSPWKPKVCVCVSPRVISWRISFYFRPCNGDFLKLCKVGLATVYKPGYNPYKWHWWKNRTFPRGPHVTPLITSETSAHPVGFNYRDISAPNKTVLLHDQNHGWFRSEFRPQVFEHNLQGADEKLTWAFNNCPEKSLGPNETMTVETETCISRASGYCCVPGLGGGCV